MKKKLRDDGLPAGIINPGNGTAYHIAGQAFVCLNCKKPFSQRTKPTGEEMTSHHSFCLENERDFLKEEN